MQTKVDRELEDAEAQHEGDPVRAGMLRLSRRFKASWLELAEALTECRRKNTWKQWGYKSFEDYTKKELHLRAETVAKLTGSYSFLKMRAPDVLARDPLTESMPTYQTVDFLRRAHERTEETGTPEVFDALYNKVVDDGIPLAKAKREFAPVLFPKSHDEQRSKDESALRGLVSRMLDLLRGGELLQSGTRQELERALNGALRELPPPKSAAPRETQAA